MERRRNKKEYGRGKARKGGREAVLEGKGARKNKGRVGEARKGGNGERGRGSQGGSRTQVPIITNTFWVLKKKK